MAVSLPLRIPRPAHASDRPAGAAAAAIPDTDSAPRLPALLVPGWSDHARAMAPLRRALLRRAWRPEQVAIAGFRDRYGCNREHAVELGAALDVLLAATRSARCDIVAHSMGGLATRLLLADAAQAARVRRVVFLGTPHRGTWLAWLARGRGGRDMRPGSELLAALAGASAAGDVELCTIRARPDLRVFPASSALLPDAHDAGRIWCSHRGLCRSRRVAARVAAELLRP